MSATSGGRIRRSRETLPWIVVVADGGGSSAQTASASRSTDTTVERCATRSGERQAHVRPTDGDDLTVACHLERSEDAQYRLHVTIFAPRRWQPAASRLTSVWRVAAAGHKPPVHTPRRWSTFHRKRGGGDAARGGKVIKGVFDQAQKEEMVHKITETMVGIEGEALRPVTSVIVEEVESGDWGIGGRSMTTQDVKDLQATST